MFETVTQYDTEKVYSSALFMPDIIITHNVESVGRRKTSCGLEIGNFPEGWIWGGEVTCEECIKD